MKNKNRKNHILNKVIHFYIVIFNRITMNLTQRPSVKVQNKTFLLWITKTVQGFINRHKTRVTRKECKSLFKITRDIFFITKWLNITSNNHSMTRTKFLKAPERLVAKWHFNNVFVFKYRLHLFLCLGCLAFWLSKII